MRVITYTYDPLNRLTAADYSSGESFAYEYDGVGNRTVFTQTLGSTTVTTYTYDAANRLTAAGNVEYTWDARGNLTNDGAFTYAYNAAGRLVQTESVTATLVYTYNAQGLRVAQSVDGDVVEFVWDWVSGVPEMLAQFRSPQSLYLVGHETLGQWDGHAWAYYLPDALGSVRQATDTAGVVTAAREWTPYGVEVGAAQAGLGYGGEWWDGSLGLQYLRARWYDGYLNQFVSPDTIVPDFRNPKSIHRYTYVFGNPINRVDPTGWVPFFRPPDVCPEPTENSRGLPEYVFAPSFRDWAADWSNIPPWQWPNFPVWLYCGDFYATAYQFVTEANDAGDSWYVDAGGTDEMVTLPDGTTFTANSLFIQDVTENGTGRPASEVCPEHGNYFHIWNGNHCGKGRPFDPGIDKYQVVAADPQYLNLNAEIYVPELEYGPALQSWGNAEFTVADTGEEIRGNQIDVFVAEGPGIRSGDYDDCPTVMAE